ncbi:MAG: glutamate-5-semialdehyde dehydrogenase [Aestuariibacter sp.]
MDISKVANSAACAAKSLSRLTTEQKNQALVKMAAAIAKRTDVIIAENAKDVAQAKESGLSEAMIDRLTLDKSRIDDIVKSIEMVASLDDPVGSKRALGTHDNGIEISKIRVPLGVICMIYEARPNVAAEASALCFKSGNGVILRCGKEAIKSSKAIVDAMSSVLAEFDLPENVLNLITNPDRSLMMDLIKQDDAIDLVIPRGGEGLIRFVSENSTIPVIQHYKGVCHLYVDDKADLEKAISILINGKAQRPGVCNALECLLVHKDVAEKFLPMVAQRAGVYNIKINACAKALAYFDGANPLADDQFGEEYLSLEIAVKVVDDMEAAIDHIDQFGSQHTEVIVTEDKARSARFQQLVDASVVMANASSRFSDGGQLGLGAEIGIATTKLHAYGPMGLESLTTEKYLVNGEGQIRT